VRWWTPRRLLLVGRLTDQPILAAAALLLQADQLHVAHQLLSQAQGLERALLAARCCRPPLQALLMPGRLSPQLLLLLRLLAQAEQAEVHWLLDRLVAAPVPAAAVPPGKLLAAAAQVLHPLLAL
jgi:hypothetical protein